MIDPDRHAHLIELQLAYFHAWDELSAYTGDDPEPLREAVRQAGMAKISALRDSGLIDEHGGFVAGQDLQRAARAAEAGVDHALR